MDHLGLAASVICGVSVGGMIAQSLVARRPDIVAGLVPCCTGARIGDADGWNARFDTVRGEGIAAMAEAIHERWVSPAFRRERLAELGGYRNMLARTSLESYAGVCAAIRDSDLTAHAAGIRVPTQCIAGSEDLATPPDAAGGLAAAIDDLAARFGGNTMMGRSRMQAALPITVADRLRTWSGPLRDHLAHLEQVRPKVERLQLGGVAGDRAALQPQARAVAADMADRLGLGNPPDAWHTTRGSLAEYGGLLSEISGSLGKMGQDVCLMAQQGVDEYQLSGGGGSSAMPHKQNPVPAELLVTLARFNATQVSGLHHALVHEQERSGAAWALEWMILPQMAQATARGLSAALEICKATARIGHPSDPN